ncbi:MAG: hypothetical protein Q8M94_14490, partial [Ignavibacteria bacterium]|nr:hypothetical protein [Ignavibacteria bacterium]
MRFICLLVFILPFSNLHSKAVKDSLETELEINKLIDAKCLDFIPLCLYFLQYDRMAWISSDSVLKEPETVLKGLGREWFCYQDQNNIWHAIYG